jgi:assimilatory nitrate reductase electron transfer subunit
MKPRDRRLVTMTPPPATADAEVLQLSDPASGTHRKVIIRDGRIVGAVLLARLDSDGAVVHLLHRAAPSDRLALLFGHRGTEGVTA